MDNKNNTKKIILAVVFVLASSSVVVFFIIDSYEKDSSKNTKPWEKFGKIDDSSFIVFTDFDEKIKAYNTKTNKIEFSGSDATSIIEYAMKSK